MQAAGGDRRVTFDYRRSTNGATVARMGTYGTTYNAAVAAELRGQRAKARITIDALVADTGYAKTTVLNYLNGRRDIPLPALVELCHALGIDPRVVFDQAEKAIERD